MAPLLTRVPKRINNKQGSTLLKKETISAVLQQPDALNTNIDAHTTTYKDNKKQKKKQLSRRKQQRMMQLIHHGHLASAINQQRSERLKDRSRGYSKYNIALSNQRRRERLKDRNRGYTPTNLYGSFLLQQKQQ